MRYKWMRFSIFLNLLKKARTKSAENPMNISGSKNVRQNSSEKFGITIKYKSRK
jgi:hypothetical protein